jgi:hypothetical protein
MSDEDKLKVANLVMLLQLCVYAADETVNISWFNRHKTKNVLNNFLNIVLSEHGHIIKAFWDVPELNMEEVTKTLDEFGKTVGTLNYYDLQKVTEIIKVYKSNTYE